MAMESPWVGWGTGLNYASGEGAHNIYLARWVENGLVALVTVVFLVVGTYRYGRRTGSYELCALAAYVFAQGFFSHNMLEDKSLLLMWGILAGRAALRHDESTRFEAERAAEVRAQHVHRPHRRRVTAAALPGKAATLS
jgi:O-antigen ligase